MSGTFTANPQSRRQQTDVVDNQSEATYKFDTVGWHHTAVAGVEISREISSIDTYLGQTSEGTAAARSTAAGRRPARASSIRHTRSNRLPRRRLTGKPTQIAIDTTSGYLIDSANYRDLVILNGGIRYDDYGIKDSGFGTSASTATVSVWGSRLRSSECRTSIWASR